MKKIIFIITFLTLKTCSGQPFKFSDQTIKKGQFIALWEINFVFADSALAPGQQLQLDSLTNFLLQHKDLNIEIGIHTDFRGNDNWNLTQSQQRANTLKKYLVDKGVSDKRLKAIGFGEKNR